MAPVIDQFPRRPLRLRSDSRRSRKRLVLLALCLLLGLPACYWGYQSIHGAILRADLKARAVRAAETLGAEGDCTSRRSRISGEETPIDCWLTATYRLRPEEGGALRTAPVHLEGRAPIFTPAAIYDPQDPGRVMLEPELERSMTWSELLGPVFLLLFPAIALLFFFASSRRGLAKAARNPEPVVVPVEKVIRQSGKTIVHTREAGAPRPFVDSFAAPEMPLVVPPPVGAAAEQEWVLALKAPGGRHYVLDAELAWLDLADDERSRLLSAARSY
jgi:hypothetical protein